MQFNYYTLKRLSKELQVVLNNATWFESFSQQKDELIITLKTESSNTFYIRCTLSNDFNCLSFPEEFSKSRKNVVKLFDQLQGLKVLSVEQYRNERAFSFHFEKQLCLVFKLFGNRANVILYSSNETPSILFKNKLSTDYNIVPETLHRKINLDFELFKRNPDVHSFFPTLGKIGKKYLSESDYDQLSVEEQWKFLLELDTQLNIDPFLILHTDSKPSLSLLPINDLKHEALNRSAIYSLNSFYLYFTKVYFVKLKKEKALLSLRQKVKKCENYISKTSVKLNTLKTETPPNQLADIIMANLHKIPKGASSTTLFNFYNSSEVKIKLKKEDSPQKNAERLYRKGKNRELEIDNLKKNIRAKEEVVLYTMELMEKIESVNQMRDLRKILKSDVELPNKTNEGTKPYKEFNYMGFRIWVGKNAKSNDLLTLKHTFKDDLWLHAKDTPGSHVVIKYIAGRNTPNAVIEKAAEIAAYYSKRKTDSLAPVIYTPAKYVRKRKGSPPGAVIVEKENVLMVPPKLSLKD